MKQLLSNLLLLSLISLTKLIDANEFEASENDLDWDLNEHTRNIGTVHKIIFWGPHNVPHPKRQRKECKLPSGIKQHICDPDNVFTATELKEIAYVIEKINDYPVCVCGENAFECDEHSNSLKVGVAVVKHLAFNTTKEELADHLRTTWDLGACQNNFVLFIAIEDQVYYHSWGLRGAHLFLRKYRADMYDKFRKKLRRNHFYKAIKSTLEDMYETLMVSHL